MPLDMKPILVALALLYAGPLLAQSPEPRRKLRILSASGWTMGINSDLTLALERLLKEEADHIKVEKIEYELPYYSDGHYLLDLPKGLTKDQLPASMPPSGEELDILESQRSILLAESQAAFPLLEKLLQYAHDGDDDSSYSPSVRRKKARIETIATKAGALRALAVGEAPVSEAWSRTLAMHYRLLVDGKKVRVTILGKRYGGLSFVLPALEKRRRELKEPILLLNLGTIALPPKYGADPHVSLKLMMDAGLRLVAFAGNDLENAEALLKAAQEGPEEERAILLATNLKPKDPAMGSPLRRFHVETVGGIKIGLISLLSRVDEVTVDRKGLPWTVGDPIAAARETVPELRFKEDVDLVVAVSHLSTQEDALLQQVPGIDLVLGDTTAEIATRRRTVVELTDWSQEVHYKPALKTRPSYFTYGEVAAEFRSNAGAWELARVEEVPTPSGPYLPRDPATAALEERVLGFFDTARRLVLPDPRGLWPLAKKPKMTYAAPEFWNLAAHLVRRRTGAEVALLRVNWLNSNAPGEVTESFASTWFDSDERLVRFRLDGRSLRSLLPRVIYETFPVEDSDPRRRWTDGVWLAQAGLDEKGLVHGTPIRDEEDYEIVTTEDVMRQTEALPGLKAATNARTEDSTLDQTVLPWLIERNAGSSASPDARTAYESEIRSMAEGVTPEHPVWRLHLRELSAQFTNTQIHNEGPFSQVKDARTQSISQVQGQGAARLFSELYWGRWRWDLGTTSRYGKVILRPRGAPEFENKTQDQFLLETELRHQTWRFERGISAGPFMNASYDTEFTPPVTPGIPIRRFFALKPGLKVFEGAALKDLHVAGVVLTDRSTRQARTEYGFETGFEWMSSLPRSKATLQTKATYLQFAPNRLDTPADLRRQLELGAKLSVPVFGNLRLSPFTDFFLFDSKLTSERGYNLVFGVSFEFSQLWKPVY